MIKQHRATGLGGGLNKLLGIITPLARAMLKSKGHHYALYSHEIPWIQ